MKNSLSNILMRALTIFVLTISSVLFLQLVVNAAEQESDIEGFVTQFYQECLGRQPDTDGLNNWVDALNSGVISGSDLAWSFIFSDEFQNKNTTDDEYLEVLYQAFFNREPDQGGYNNWLSLLAEGTDRSTVLEGFISSQEFITLCDDYGIEATSSASENMTVEGFVTRFYQECLGREPDTDGLNAWIDALNSGSLSGSDLAWSFIFSDEFTNLNTSNSEFVTILYIVLFDREADTDGYNNWMNKLTVGESRSSILEGFTSSEEFISLCEYYGITPSEPEPEPETNSSPAETISVTFLLWNTLLWHIGHDYHIEYSNSYGTTCSGDVVDIQYLGYLLENTDVMLGTSVKLYRDSSIVWESEELTGNCKITYTDSAYKNGDTYDIDYY